jgi:hypothetical protein
MTSDNLAETYLATKLLVGMVRNVVAEAGVDLGLYLLSVSQVCLGVLCKSVLLFLCVYI